MKNKTFVAIFGSFIEWFDFAMVGALATHINKNFFDTGEPISNLINIFSILAVGYLARPLGAFFFGYYGDQYGRQSALRLSLFLVSITTFFLGCLPTQDSAGEFAAIGLVALRFIQGIGSGGEHAGGILLLYEDETTNRYQRSNYAILAIMLGLFCGFFSAYLLGIFFDMDEILDWAWRIPFIFGGTLGLIGVVLRMRFLREAEPENISNGLIHYKKFFSENRKQILIACGIYIHSVAIFHTNYFFYPGYMEEHEFISTTEINEIRVFMAVVFVGLFISLGKYLSNRNAIGWLKFSSLGTAILIFPLHYAMIDLGFYGYCLAIFVLTALNVIYLLPVAGTLAGLFSKTYRYSGVSLSINVVSSVFGGTAPLLLAFLVGYSGSFFASGTYLFTTALVSYLIVRQFEIESK